MTATMGNADALADAQMSRAVSKDRLTLFLLLGATLLRAIVPGLVQLLAQGRATPLKSVEPFVPSLWISSAASLGLVVVSLTVLAGRGGRPGRHWALVWWAAWLAVSALAAYVGIGGLVLSTAVVGGLSLLAVARLRVPDHSAIATFVAWSLGSVMLAALMMAVLVPETAKYGIATAPWLTRDARLAGPLSTPNELANVAVLALISAASLRGRAGRWPYVLMVVSSVVLILTQSYTAWMAAVVGVAVLFAAPRLSRLGSPSYGRLSFIGLGAVGVAWIASKIETTEFTGLSGRRLIWTYVGEHWRERPYLGFGANIWRHLIDAGVTPKWAVNGHNQVFDALFTAGLAGFLVLLLALVSTLSRAVSAWRNGAPLVMALVVVEIVRSYTEVPFQILYGGFNLFLVFAIMSLTSAFHSSRRLP